MDELDELEIEFLDDIDIDDILANTQSREDALFRLRSEIYTLEDINVGCWDE